jgi:phosphatidate cytidylyltransferase
MIGAIGRREVVLLCAVVAVLIAATVTGAILALRSRGSARQSTVRNLNARVRAWWVMCAVLVLAIFSGPTGAAVLFGLVSFLALREFLELVPTRRGDHRSLLASFFIFTPLQYLLVARGWYGLYSILIPVYAFLFLPTRAALRGETAGFLERAAELQWALMICVYALSYAPALMTLQIPSYASRSGGLLLFLLVVVEASDVLQYIWGKLLGSRQLAPEVSPNKTWEGLIGGTASATMLGALLWWLTPFTPLEAGALSLVAVLMGVAGGLTMSAIKRDRGIKDWGSLIAGHGGVLDRVDSLCFAAPIFFHLTRYFFARG